MKKHVLFFILTIFITQTKAQTSVYHPFPDSNAVWNVTIQYLHGCYTINPVSYTFSYTFSGDTTINSKTYHKLVVPYVQDLDTACFGVVAQAGYQGCISQDTAARKVYIISPNDTTPYILYDFSLQVGDKFLVGGCQFGPNDSIISIDSILIGTNYRKRWNGWNGIVPYIEGIGYTLGLFQPCSGHDLGPYFNLTCFSQNGVTLYPNDTSCNVIASVNALSVRDNSVSIDPNPFSTSATFIINSPSPIHNSQLVIYDIVGRKLEQIIINDQSTIINRNGLPSGIYMYEVNNDRGQEIIARGRFVIE